MKLLFFSHISPFLVSGLIVNSQTFTLQLVKVRLVACIALGYRCNCKLCVHVSDVLARRLRKDATRQSQNGLTAFVELALY